MQEQDLNTFFNFFLCYSAWDPTDFRWKIYRLKRRTPRGSGPAWNNGQILLLIVKAWVTYNEQMLAWTEIPTHIKLRTGFLSVMPGASLLPGGILIHSGFSKKGIKKYILRICSALFSALSKQVVMNAGDETAAVRGTYYYFWYSPMLTLVYWFKTELFSFHEAALHHEYILQNKTYLWIFCQTWANVLLQHLRKISILLPYVACCDMFR